MSTTQKIFIVRRNYNQWVNNQTLEDYALRFTAKSARRWSLARVSNTALGAITFLALEAIGGAITLSYGFDNASLAILSVGILLFLAGIPICYYAAKYGVDIDLLTRGAGFGYIGSTATSLIYASFTFIFFALEAAIMAMALKLLLGIPLIIGYIICSVIVIPLVTHGITLISRFQLWTQPLWVVLQLIPLVYVLLYDMQSVQAWQNFQGVENYYPGQVSLIYFGAATAVLFSLSAQIGEQVDFLRFLPEKKSTNNFRWWFAMLAAGPGWVIIGVIKLFAGSLLAYIALQNGVGVDAAADPTNMYTIAFQNLTGNPQTALIVSAIFVILSQLKINVTNAYAGSIAWSNFFSRLTHSHPGRVVWLVFNVFIALMLMEMGLYETFEQTLGAYAIVAVSWVSCLVADLIINKPLKLSPKHIEFRRAYLYDINPVGVVSMIVSSLIGMIAYTGLVGEELQALAHFITILLAFILTPCIAIITKGRFYLARQQTHFHENEVECSICENTYEKEDMAYCPAYGGNICSLCCSLDARCNDMCKKSKSLQEYIADIINIALPKSIALAKNSRLISFGLLNFFMMAIIAILLILTYISTQTGDVATDLLMYDLLWKVFFILIIFSAVISWFFILASESRQVAQEESQNQNLLLLQEIQAHEKTDLELQKAKEIAESANQAKSRYLTGISHELRTPLNSILGYAQILELDKTLPDNLRSKIATIRRSGQHLGDIIEGLLNISQIEAGRLQIHRDQVNIHALLDQIVFMFHLQAKNKGLTFNYQSSASLPEFVTTDEKRLRQILINLLSNAIKFTNQGSVSFSVTYKNQVAQFEIKDSGIGIPDEDIERVFKPFERANQTTVAQTPGTGLGLTITQLLAEILGGELKHQKNPEGGTIFTVWLMLSEVISPNKEIVPVQKVYGYKGEIKTITVVDDELTHRQLIQECLMPLNFAVFEASSAEQCLKMHSNHEPDLYLLDFSMPNKNGWELAKELRALNYKKPIIIVSANAYHRQDVNFEDNIVNDHIIKPFNIDTLIEKIGQWLKLEWHYDLPEQQLAKITEQSDLANNHLPKEIVDQINLLAEIGHLSELKKLFKQLDEQDLIETSQIDQINIWLEELRFDKILASIGSTQNA